ncbi:hypothetical protein BDA99DRAFT_563476 [Phascolomyces articulosus]|uniref:Uncharacterized protein n=1 Tax=Phascolomyces articulosus TaxID=60185 RepID=A0AAD5JS14_9FUNG|nr:hypothetical protein BDA99DRAFT_563476 [Phascolomyces articulosus]
MFGQIHRTVKFEVKCLVSDSKATTLASALASPTTKKKILVLNDRTVFAREVIDFAALQCSGDFHPMVLRYSEANKKPRFCSVSSLCPPTKDLGDENWNNVLTDEQLNKIDEVGDPLLPSLPPKIDEILNEVSRLKNMVEAYNFGRNLPHDSLKESLNARPALALQNTAKLHFLYRW